MENKDTFCVVNIQNRFVRKFKKIFILTSNKAVVMQPQQAYKDSCILFGVDNLNIMKLSNMRKTCSLKICCRLCKIKKSLRRSYFSRITVLRDSQSTSVVSIYKCMSPKHEMSVENWGTKDSSTRRTKYRRISDLCPPRKMISFTFALYRSPTYS
jgi:hypothetical protein